MAKHPFLSQGWIEAARAARQGAGVTAAAPAVTAPAAGGPAAAAGVRMNLVVEKVPFGEGRLEAHLDSSSGELEIELGHLAEPDVKVVLDYPTARALLVESDGQAALQAFMEGRIRVEGDLARLLQYQASPPSPAQLAVAEQLRAITA